VEWGGVGWKSDVHGWGGKSSGDGGERVWNDGVREKGGGGSLQLCSG